MSKLNYGKMDEIKKQELERLFWKAFWCYSEELGLNKSESEKEKMLHIAHVIIPEYAASAMEYDFAYDYPLFQLLIQSLLAGQNLLGANELKVVMGVEGPDDDAKLARIVMELQKGGMTWESS